MPQQTNKLKFFVELYDGNSLILVPNGFDADQVLLFKGFPERKWINNSETKGWVVPITTPNLDYLYRTWLTDEYKIDEQANRMIKYEKLTNKVDSLKAEKRWDYLFNGQDTDFIYPSPLPPFMHQIVTVEASRGAEYFGLLMDMGTGKTKCAVDECSLLGLELNSNQMIRIVVVCPKPLMINWAREFDKNMPDCVDFVYHLLNKGDSKSIDQIMELLQDPSRVKIAIVSYRSVDTLIEQLMLLKPTLLICDESHNIKNHKTKSWKAVKKLADVCAMRRILTGTVTCNNILDIWAQFEILRPGALGYATYDGFKNAFCTIENVGQDGEFEKIVGFNNVDQLKETMARMSFTVKKEQCLTLPEKMFDIIEVEMPANMREIYDQMANEFALELDGAAVDTQCILAQMMKLSQICSGFFIGKEANGTEKKDIFNDDGEFITQLELEVYRNKLVEIPGGDAKMLVMLEDAVQACSEGKLIIWSRFQYDNKNIETRLRALGIECGRYDGTVSDDVRQETVDRFNNDPKFRCFIGNPAAGGTGLTLLGDTSENGSPHNRTKNVFYYSNDFSYNKRVQSEDRCHRIGLRNPVMYRDYVYQNSIEQYIAGVLQAKGDIADCVKDVAKIKNLLVKQKEAVKNV